MTTSVVYCIIPVHNRKEVTKHCLEYLDAQDYPSIQIVIVDDGSTDGTGEYLARCARRNLTVLKGDGNLWWGGAMRVGMKYVADLARDSDYLLMLNDDVHIDPDYVSSMVGCSLANNSAVVGSVQRDEKTREMIGCGYQIDFFSMRISPLVTVDANTTIHAFPGRGLLIPWGCVRKVGYVNSRLFSHYLGDIEYTQRLVESGFKLVASMDSPIYTSSENSDSDIRRRGWLHRLFSPRSADNVFYRLAFFTIRGPMVLRFLSLPRFIFLSAGRFLKRQ